MKKRFILCLSHSNCRKTLWNHKPLDTAYMDNCNTFWKTNDSADDFISEHNNIYKGQSVFRKKCAVLLEEATVSLTSGKNFMIEDFLMGLEDFLLSVDRILLDETFRKDLIEGDRKGNVNGSGDRVTWIGSESFNCIE